MHVFTSQNRQHIESAKSFEYRFQFLQVIKVLMQSICVAPPHEASLRRSGIARIVKGKQFYLHTLLFISKRNEPYLPLPSQPQGWKAEQTLVRSSPGRDSNPQPSDCKSLYHTATSAPRRLHNITSLQFFEYLYFAKQAANNSTQH